MSGGIIKSKTMRKLSVILFSVCVLLVPANVVAQNAAVAKTAQTAATAAVKTATSTPTKTATPPKQTAVAAKTAAAKVSSSLVQNKTTAKPKAKKVKKVIKMRKQVVDAKIVVWGRTSEDAEASANEAARKLVGSKDQYLIKDTIFIYEAKNKVICMLRVNFTDEIPETWYLETEMSTGFGKNYEQAYREALNKAAGRAKLVMNSTDWTSAKSSAKNASELGVVPYDYVFATVNNEKHCRLFFRYMAPR